MGGKWDEYKDLLSETQELNQLRNSFDLKSKALDNLKDELLSFRSSCLSSNKDLIVQINDQKIKIYQLKRMIKEKKSMLFLTSNSGPLSDLQTDLLAARIENAALLKELSSLNDQEQSLEKEKISEGYSSIERIKQLNLQANRREKQLQVLLEMLHLKVNSSNSLEMD